MEVISLNQAKKMKFDNSSVALGTFDGLHLGHLAIIDAAKKYEGNSIVFTFDSLPVDLFLKGHVPIRLFTLEEKIEAFKNTGIDYICIVHFDKKFADMDEEDFTKLINKVFCPKNVIAGFNYTYGKDAKGNVQTLKKEGKELGFLADIISPVIFEGLPISSSRIRECIANGDIQTANTLLGYKYKVSGKVQKGKGIGKKIGFPTANIKVSKQKILPPGGVYSVEVIAKENIYKGVCNIGVNPTVSKDNRQTVEVHVIEMADDLYDKEIDVLFVRRLRDEKKFSNLDDLKNQISLDIKNI